MFFGQNSQTIWLFSHYEQYFYAQYAYRIMLMRGPPLYFNVFFNNTLACKIWIDMGNYKIRARCEIHFEQILMRFFQ